jgi:hypothetical protein
MAFNKGIQPGGNDGISNPIRRGGVNDIGRVFVTTSRAATASNHDAGSGFFAALDGTG